MDRHVIVVTQRTRAKMETVMGTRAAARCVGIDPSTLQPPYVAVTPIRGGWQCPVESANAPTKLVAWGFWVSTEDKNTRSQLVSLRDQGIIKLYVGPVDGGPVPDAQWKADCGWVDA